MSLFDLIDSNKTKDEIKDVPPLPAGTYLALGVGQYTKIEAKNEKRTRGVEFEYRLIQAEEDVDANDLKEHLEARQCSLHDITGKYTIWDSPFAEGTLRNFVYNALGVDPNMPINQAVAEYPGRNFKLHFRHTPLKGSDGEMRMRAEIDKTLAAD